MDEDDGDYATLRELPLPPSSPQRLSSGEDTASEEGKVCTEILIFFLQASVNYSYKINYLSIRLSTFFIMELIIFNGKIIQTE